MTCRGVHVGVYSDVYAYLYIFKCICIFSYMRINTHTHISIYPNTYAAQVEVCEQHAGIARHSMYAKRVHQHFEAHIQYICKAWWCRMTCLSVIHTQGDRDGAAEGGQGPPLQGNQLHIPCRCHSSQHSHSIAALPALPAGLIQISRPACSHRHWAHREGGHAVGQGVE